MKIQYLLLLLILAINFSCNSENKTTNSVKSEPQKEEYLEKIVIEDVVNYDFDFKKIDIDKEIKDDNSSFYLLNYKNDNLSLCDFEQLYNPFYSLEKDTLEHYLKEYVIKVENLENYSDTTYYKNTSSIKIVTYIDEHSEETVNNLGKGILLDTSIVLSNGVKIGMDKNSFLSIFFIYDKAKMKNLKQIAVCQDPRGEDYTKYKFKYDKLQEIEFGSLNEY